MMPKFKITFIEDIPKLMTVEVDAKNLEDAKENWPYKQWYNLTSIKEVDGSVIHKPISIKEVFNHDLR